MIRTLAAVAVLLSVSACSKPGLATIEEAESFAQARGVVLTDKKEDTDQIVAPRSYDYKSGEIKIGITQFNTPEAAETWRKAMDEMPGGETLVPKGHVVFSIWGGADADRQKLIAALK
ncbi:hypothetical protein D187_007497 [Cystobacter fuscus DSM 2262]|uniref:Lipoprotein n=1 Tax=Cystobacter fuscus (strain ATCC 25194 / DSM 2262 / NBRC 100088 / M29) TaxID=1242864 RepID=S9NVG6_CYSF2|nr:hypothetical protein [Cystobacter fuscus]EPX56155.1 hypothetical protein D187_007497 [Cystobacter fuscus DSM 2262]